MNAMSCVAKWAEYKWLTDLLEEPDFALIRGRYLVGVGKVTPPAAALILESHNGQNRPMGPSAIKRLADAMGRGLFMLNGESVIFDDSGLMRNGQHRMQACIDSESAFETFVVCGVPSVSYKTQDQHNRRSFWQVLSSMGVKNPKITAAGIYALNKFIRTGEFGGFKGTTPQMDDLVDCLNSHPSLSDSAEFVRGLGRIVAMLRGYGGVCCLHYLMSRGRHGGMASPFFTALSTLSIPTDGPWSGMRLLAKRLLEDQASKKGKLPSRVILGYTIKAWNSLVTGKTAARLTFEPGDPFPEIEGMDYNEDGLPILAS